VVRKDRDGKREKKTLILKELSLIYCCEFVTSKLGLCDQDLITFCDWKSRWQFDILFYYCIEKPTMDSLLLGRKITTWPRKIWGQVGSTPFTSFGGMIFAEPTLLLLRLKSLILFYALL